MGQSSIDGMDNKLISTFRDIDKELSLSIERANSDYQRKIQELKDQHTEELSTLNHISETSKETAKRELAEEKTKAIEEIAKCKNSQAVKEQELLNIDSLEEQAIVAIDEKTNERIETEKAKVGSVKQDSEREIVPIVPLQTEADKVADMQSYLREFDRMKDIIETKLAPRQERAQTLTARIQTARELPMELLKIASVPIPEINVDGEGRIRIGETLLDGLSEGEQLELAFRVAKAQAGELKVICIDGIDKINPEDRKWLEAEMETDELQYFVLSTRDDALRVEIKDSLF
jgi:hypothetical protein